MRLHDPQDRSVNVRIVWHDEAVAAGEPELVPKDKLRKAKARLLQNPECGKTLGRQLTGARSIRVGGSENRLVYRLIREAPDSLLIEILALERRRGNEAYDTAEGRI